MLIADTARSESGFTLIEVLVAAVMGVVVIGATMAILTVALHQNILLTDKVQADQTARTTMTKIVNALHSSCLASGFTPVQEKSTASKLIFVNDYSSIAAIPSASESASEGAYKHEIEFEPSKSRFVDKAYPSTSVASWPEITFSSTASKTTVLGERISPVTVKKRELTFQYYKYSVNSTTGSEAALSTLTEVEPPSGGLTATTAKEIAAVQVSFATAPKSGDKRASRTITLSNQVTFAFSAPAAETPISDAPCE